jgi:hypothetical protein
MDKFSLGGIFIHVIFCIWFAVFGVGLLTSDKSFAETLEMYVLCGFGAFYVLFLAFVIIFHFIWAKVYTAKFQLIGYTQVNGDYFLNC